MSESRNVLGGPLSSCSERPKTGWFRTGCCETDDSDLGRHVVCALMTEEFLAFSKARGNDLTRPGPGFAGLRPGDRWCLCAARWREAFEADAAPPVVLEATEESALELIALEALEHHAVPAMQPAEA